MFYRTCMSVTPHVVCSTELTRVELSHVVCFGEYPLYIDDSSNSRELPNLLVFDPTMLYIVGEYPLYIDDSSNSRELPNLPVFDSAGESEDHTYRAHHQVMRCSHSPSPAWELVHWGSGYNEFD